MTEEEKTEVIKFLSMWMIEHTPGKMSPGLLNIPIFIGISALLFELKGTKSETFTIEGNKEQGD